MDSDADAALPLRDDGDCGIGLRGADFPRLSLPSSVPAGKADPGGPQQQAKQMGSNFKSKEETEGKKSIYTTVVGGLLVIAFVVPMVQYYGARGTDAPACKRRASPV